MGGKTKSIRDYENLIYFMVQTGGKLPFDIFDAYCTKNDGRWLSKNGYIRFGTTINAGKIARLTRKSDKFFKEFFGVRKYSPASDYHDVNLARACHEHLKENDRLITPYEYLEKSEHRLGVRREEKGAPDVIVYEQETKEYYAIELVTSSYRKSDIEEKIVWCQDHQLKLKIVDVDGNRSATINL